MAISVSSRSPTASVDARFVVWTLILAAASLEEVSVGAVSGLGDWSEQGYEWPKGTYAVPVTGAGQCPGSGGDADEWRTGQVFQDVVQEWREGGRDVEGARGGGRDGEGYSLTMTQEQTRNSFCTKTVAGQFSRFEFMPGRYCVWKRNLCPDGFEEGWIRMDTRPTVTSSGDLPDGSYENLTVRVAFCCRGDGDPAQAIRLPDVRPFALLRLGHSVCQTVENMDASDGWSTWHGAATVSDGLYPEIYGGVEGGEEEGGGVGRRGGEGGEGGGGEGEGGGGRGGEGGEEGGEEGGRVGRGGEQGGGGGRGGGGRGGGGGGGERSLEMETLNWTKVSVCVYRPRRCGGRCLAVFLHLFFISLVVGLIVFAICFQLRKRCVRRSRGASTKLHFFYDEDEDDDEEVSVGYAPLLPFHDRRRCSSNRDGGHMMRDGDSREPVARLPPQPSTDDDTTGDADEDDDDEEDEEEVAWDVTVFVQLPQQPASHLAAESTGDVRSAAGPTDEEAGVRRSSPPPPYEETVQAMEPSGSVAAHARTDAAIVE